MEAHVCIYLNTTYRHPFTDADPLGPRIAGAAFLGLATLCPMIVLLVWSCKRCCAIRKTQKQRHEDALPDIDASINSPTKRARAETQSCKWCCVLISPPRSFANAVLSTTATEDVLVGVQSHFLLQVFFLPYKSKYWWWYFVSVARNAAIAALSLILTTQASLVSDTVEPSHR